MGEALLFTPTRVPPWGRRWGQSLLRHRAQSEEGGRPEGVCRYMAGETSSLSSETEPVGANYLPHFHLALCPHTLPLLFQKVLERCPLIPHGPGVIFQTERILTFLFVNKGIIFIGCQHFSEITSLGYKFILYTDQPGEGSRRSEFMRQVWSALKSAFLCVCAFFKTVGCNLLALIEAKFDIGFNAEKEATFSIEGLFFFFFFVWLQSLLAGSHCELQRYLGTN